MINNISTSKKKKSHRWRLCPAGEHWVITHDRIVKKSKKNPMGLTSVEGHCRKNRSRKDQIYPDELREIAQKYFSKLTTEKVVNNLGFKRNGNRYDQLITGWTKFWNEIFKSEEPLDPKVVKALIATESGFNSNAENDTVRHGKARGLMQLTESTIKALKDEKGELSDFLVDIDLKEAYDPNLNIAAGIRWLFQKKKTGKFRFKRKISWEEAIAEYKGILASYKKTKKSERMDKFHFYFNKFKK